MIERKIISQKIKEFQIQEFIAEHLRNVGHSGTKMVKTPLGEKVIIYVARPGLVVGRKGQNIKQLTKTLKKRFNLENPQIEISEIENINLDAHIVAEWIANSLEKFGLAKFKGIGHKVMTDVMNAGALGIEIIISGKIPSSRAKSWRFYQGYLKKCGDSALVNVRKAYRTAQLKTGVIGIKVSIMPPDAKLPDDIEIVSEEKESAKNIQVKTEEAKKEDIQEENKSEEKKGKTTKRKSRAKKKPKEEQKEPHNEEAEETSKEE